MYLLNEDKAYGKCVSFKAHKDLQRGALLEIVGKGEGILGANDLELFEVKDASATTPVGQLLVNNAVVKQYDERLVESDFYVKQGEVGRGRNPERHCTHTIAAALVGEVVVAGDVLELGAGVFMKKNTGVAIAVVEEVLTWKGQESVVVRYL